MAAADGTVKKIVITLEHVMLNSSKFSQNVEVVVVFQMPAIRKTISTNGRFFIGFSEVTCNFDQPEFFSVRAKIVKYRNAYLPIAFVPCAGNSLGCIAPETLCLFRRLADLASQLSSPRGPACFHALRHRFLAEIFEATATRLLRGVSELPNTGSLLPLPTLTPLVSAVSPAPSHTADAAATATESSLSVHAARSYSSVIQLTSPPTGDHLASTYGWNTVFAAPSPSSTL